MVDSIKGIGSALAQAQQAAKGQAGVKDASFGDLLKESIDNVNKAQLEADKAMESLAKGETKNIHETMIAIEKANLSFNMMVQVRNKLINAYEEIMRMQV